LGAETPKNDIVFDASLYPFKFHFNGSNFLNLFTSAKGGLNFVGVLVFGYEKPICLF
jgi:hypothetical protein